MAMKKKKKSNGGRPEVENPLRVRCFRATDEQWLRWSVASGGEKNVSAWVRRQLDLAARRSRR